MTIKETLEKKRFTVEITPDEDGGYVGRCLELPAALSQGETKEELLANMKEAIQLVLETIEETSSEKEKVVIEIIS